MQQNPMKVNAPNRFPINENLIKIDHSRKLIIFLDMKNFTLSISPAFPINKIEDFINLLSPSTLDDDLLYSINEAVMEETNSEIPHTLDDIISNYISQTLPNRSTVTNDSLRHKLISNLESIINSHLQNVEDNINLMEILTKAIKILYDTFIQYEYTKIKNPKEHDLLICTIKIKGNTIIAHGEKKETKKQSRKSAEIAALYSIFGDALINLIKDIIKINHKEELINIEKESKPNSVSDNPINIMPPMKYFIQKPFEDICLNKKRSRSSNQKMNYSEEESKDFNDDDESSLK